MNILCALLLPFVLSAILIPFLIKIAVPAKAYALENKRTVHHGHIPRIGGVAIYIASIITMALLYPTDRSILGMYIASSVMFFTGLIDDFVDLPAKVKLFFQFISALILLAFGIRVDSLRLLGFTFDIPLLSVLFTLLWVVGISNAINLSDGLDGLCGGMNLVVLSVVIAISLVDRRFDIVLLALILSGAILGFLIFNAHPASIFMGDCGSLFLGCMTASISLLGFKSSTMMTLAFPILILILPITDTLSAMLRRKIAHKSVNEADKAHLHHQLMRRFGMANSVIIMCAITFLFGMCAFLYIVNKPLGLIAMLLMMLAVELFIERSGMISPKFHPLCSLIYQIRKALHLKK